MFWSYTWFPGAEKRTFSEMQRRRFQDVQEDEPQGKRESIEELFFRELTRGEYAHKGKYMSLIGRVRGPYCMIQTSPKHQDTYLGLWAYKMRLMRCFFVFLALKEGRHLTTRSGPCSRILPVKLANHSVRISEVIIVRVISEKRGSLMALVNEDTLLRTHCCPGCFLGCADWETFIADTKCFWTK